MKLDELPDDVLFYITEYFEIGDELNEILNHHKFFRNIPRIHKKYLYTPNSEKSLKYYNMLYENITKDEWFYNISQFKIALHIFNVPIYDVTKLGHVHILDLSYCDSIVDVSALGNVHTLILSQCENITDVSALGNVHTLDLTWCEKITDVYALGNVHNLDLSYCRNITNVSALGNIHILDLSYCDNICNVSALKNVHTLILYGCYKITDTSMSKNTKIIR